jgi:hypothetical protein
VSWGLFVIAAGALIVVAAPVCSWLERRAAERDRRMWDRWLRGERWP